jgi:hypothetical protein
MLLSFAGAGLMAFWLATRHWNRRDSNDLGRMSRRWLEEYNAQHP